MEEYRRTVVTHHRWVDGQWVEVPDPSEAPVTGEEVIANSAKSCVTGPVVPYRLEPKGRTVTESDRRAFQKRVEKRRAKKKRK